MVTGQAMSRDSARDCVAEWMDLFNRRCRMFAPRRFSAMSRQEVLAAAVQRQLELFTPEGEHYVFCNKHTPAAVAVIADDAVFVTSLGSLEETDGGERTETELATRRLAFADIEAVEVEVDYSLGSPTACGYHERWKFSLPNAALDIETFGGGNDRELPRLIARAAGWPVPPRDD